MINTSFHQEQKPDSIKFDSKGTLLFIGAPVAYNRSGNVDIGYIKEIKQNDWKVSRNGVGNKKWWNIQFEILIENKEGYISKIKNPNSFVII